MQSISKCELHLHLGGSYPISYLESICENDNDIIQLKEFLKIMALKTIDMNYHVCFQSFNIINKIVNSYEKVQNGDLHYI